MKKRALARDGQKQRANEGDVGSRREQVYVCASLKCLLPGEDYSNNPSLKMKRKCPL